jgi:hypothetical protein
MREEEAARRRRVYRKALVRVRFADGLLLQGTFAVGAPVARLLQWARAACHARPRPATAAATSAAGRPPPRRR